MRWESGAFMNTAAAAASTALAYGVVLYAAHRVAKSCLVQLEKSQQTTFFVDRIWKIVTQGYSTVGLVAKDLGEPDEDGVYTYSSSVGHLYFRMVSERWEFSRDRVFWIPTAYADSLWFSPEDSPSLADKVVIQRLEVEAELKRSHKTCNALQPPALDLSMTEKDLSGMDCPSMPKEFLCPISMRLMTDPVVTPAGITYDRSALEKWINDYHTDPATGMLLRQDQLYANLTIRDMIQKWLVEPDIKVA